MLRRRKIRVRGKPNDSDEINRMLDELEASIEEDDDKEFQEALREIIQELREENSFLDEVELRLDDFDD